MNNSLREYLANAAKRDAEAREEREEAQARAADAENSRDDELSVLIDEHSIGRLRSRCRHTVG